MHPSSFLLISLCIPASLLSVQAWIKLATVIVKQEVSGRHLIGRLL